MRWRTGTAELFSAGRASDMDIYRPSVILGARSFSNNTQSADLGEHSPLTLDPNSMNITGITLTGQFLQLEPLVEEHRPCPRARRKRAPDLAQYAPWPFL